MPEAPKILIVDDDPDLTESMRIILESRGYRVVSAEDADSGLEKTKRERPDLILLDVMMPTGTEGFHFVWKLRGEEKSEVREIPIIMLTAIHEQSELRFYPDQSDGTYAPGEYLPVQEFIDKPVQPAELLERVERTLRAARGPAR